MSDLRAAAMLALEAMDEVNWCGGDITNAFLEDAIIALRTALAKPSPPPEAQTEAEKIAYCAGWWAAMQAKREEGISPPSQAS